MLQAQRKVIYIKKMFLIQKQYFQSRIKNICEHLVPSYFVWSHRENTPLLPRTDTVRDSTSSITKYACIGP
jgi:hypothetical protein